MNYNWAHSGIDGLDVIIQGLRRGDNVVWQINKIDVYRSFVQDFVKRALKDKKKVVYMRFASHQALLDINKKEITVYKLNASSGFESFAAEIHDIITKEGQGTYYVFDCLSDLLSYWATDLMIGNFFVVTCPYLFELDTIAYFAIFREKHSYKTIARIQETTQVLIDLYQEDDNYYIHPIKVWNRYSSTMFLPHIKKGESFIPVNSSFDASNLFSSILKYNDKKPERNLDYWDRLFLEAQDLIGNSSLNDRKIMLEKLANLLLSKDEKIMGLIKKYFDLDDLLGINSRLIGSGFIGGKSLGMLLARKILLKNKDDDWGKYLERHDSFYIGSDVFYTYIVQNAWWKLYLKQKNEQGYFKIAKELREKLLEGKFPDEIIDQFHNMLDYFGQSPIIVRSSSLLEDGFGNAFAGKYDSFFCVNQGTPEERYQQFEEAVKKVYASTMNEDALVYRQQRGLHNKDEQMALLVQRVSGSYHQHYFFPDMAGVGVSYNTFVWDDKLDPEAGMLRLVFGLGTRAVDRVEGDYPRIIALDNVHLQSYSNNDDYRKYSQHKIDLLHILENSLKTIHISKLMGKNLNLPHMKLIGQIDQDTNKRLKKLNYKDEEAWIINFESLLKETDFARTMQKLLKLLEKEYQYPVDIEFTVNLTHENEIKINLVQCRPLQIRGIEEKIEKPTSIDGNKLLFESKGHFMGGNFIQPIKRVVYVEAETYSQLSLQEKYDIARLIGKLNREIKNQEEMPTLLIGPGRWGTTTPSLGVPVTFSEINNMKIIMEVAYNLANFTPELSFGSHFFQDLVESDIYYIALFPDNKECIFNKELLKEKENILGKIVKGSEKYDDVVFYSKMDEDIFVYAELLTQKVLGSW
ncbi:MAG: PEP/pyruvate-binding domain-containing protein [Bacillota bacterium]